MQLQSHQVDEQENLELTGNHDRHTVQNNWKDWNPSLRYLNMHM